MKKILGAIFGIFAFFELLVLAGATTIQPQKLGAAALQSRTVAQIGALQTNTTGYILFCSNCAGGGGAGTICVSTGTGVGAFVLSTGTLCQ